MWHRSKAVKGLEAKHGVGVEVRRDVAHAQRPAGRSRLPLHLARRKEIHSTAVALRLLKPRSPAWFTAASRLRPQLRCASKTSSRLRSD